jgi:hypothetical protein
MLKNINATSAPPALMLPRDFNRGGGRAGKACRKTGTHFLSKYVSLVRRFYCHLENAIAGAIRLLSVMFFLPYKKPVPAYRH